MKGLIAGGIVAGIALFLYFQYKAIYNYTIKFKNATVDKFGLNNAIITLYVNFTNASVYSLTATGYAFDIYINGVFVSNVVSNVPFKVKSYGTSLLTLKVVFSPRDLANPTILKAASYYLTDRSKIIVTVKGFIDAEAYGINIKNLPVNYSDNLQDLMS